MYRTRLLVMLGVWMGMFTVPILSVAASGKAVYESTCIACHGAGGEGVLTGVPDLTDTKGPLSKPDPVLMDNMINGFQSPDSPMAMPPKGGNPALTREDIEMVLRYMRETFRGK